MRPLGIPATEDKLLQEVVKMVLEAIYEESFEYTSHGFRPKRSCHTALKQIEKSFCGVKWYIEGDIKGFFDNINHDVMIGILEERINDARFIRLIRKFLNAGYIEDWEYFTHITGHRKVASSVQYLPISILINWTSTWQSMQQNLTGMPVKKRTHSTDTTSVRKNELKKALKSAVSLEERKLLVEQIRKYDNLMLQTPAKNDMDCNYKRLEIREICG